ncbi:MAG: hypothetical protein HFJ42_02005 [Clostridia bacterium]|nr:hypothetical protein [Clostridia bacterium]
MKQEQLYSVQDWLPFQKILDNGIIKLEENLYVKIIQINPINFNLKSELEKEAILNSYKLFLKTCNFDIQILIQSNKEDLSKHISKINSQKNIEKENIKKISENYIGYIKRLNQNKKSSNKRFYIIIKNIKTHENIKTEEMIIEELNDNFYKIKECLARCGNVVKDITTKDQIISLLYSFVNTRMYNNDNTIM